MNNKEVYVDPSALVQLYIHQASSRSIATWRAGISGPLLVTHHGRSEIVNAICRAAFHELISREASIAALEDLEADFAHGHLLQADILWRATLNRAILLSQRFTPKLGTRASDVLHVASALELNARRFLTFDVRQRELAKTVNLKPIVI